MEQQNQNIKLTVKHGNTKLKKIKPLLDVNLEVQEIDQEIVLNIRIDISQVVDTFKYLLEESFQGYFNLVGNDNENGIKELPDNERNNITVVPGENNGSLTGREIEIMEKLSCGKLNKEIADELNLCTNTVRTHLRNIFPKLRAENRSEAIIEYLKITGKFKRISSDE
jgi:DNA-binding NarL/FixJ family response regulator